MVKVASKKRKSPAPWDTDQESSPKRKSSRMARDRSRDREDRSLHSAQVLIEKGVPVAITTTELGRPRLVQTERRFNEFSAADPSPSGAEVSVGTSPVAAGSLQNLCTPDRPDGGSMVSHSLRDTDTESSDMARDSSSTNRMDGVAAANRLAWRRQAPSRWLPQQWPRLRWSGQWAAGDSK